MSPLAVACCSAAARVPCRRPTAACCAWATTSPTWPTARCCPGESLVREYSRADLSSFPAVGTIDPASAKRAEVAETYRRWLTSSFGEWRLSVSGAVARPGDMVARGVEEPPVAHADHETHLRGGLDGHRRVDGRAAEPRAGRSGPAAVGAVRHLQVARPPVRQHRPARRSPSADAAGLRHERPRPAGRRMARRCGSAWNARSATRA